ncbi:MAG: PaaI family thioesterase [Thermomonas sp.]|nr:PaaI family thioesterase [Thermomonas sp.]
MAPNGFLHAASVIALADTAAGYGCVANLPEGASGFMTVELQPRGPAGAIDACKAAHLGKATHVWDATVTHRESGRTLALFRCTQMVLYAKQGA